MADEENEQGIGQKAFVAGFAGTMGIFVAALMIWIVMFLVSALLGVDFLGIVSADETARSNAGQAEAVGKTCENYFDCPGALECRDGRCRVPR